MVFSRSRPVSQEDCYIHIMIRSLPKLIAQSKIEPPELLCNCPDQFPSEFRMKIIEPIQSGFVVISVQERILDSFVSFEEEVKKDIAELSGSRHTPGHRKTGSG